MEFTREPLSVPVRLCPPPAQPNLVAPSSFNETSHLELGSSEPWPNQSRGPSYSQAWSWASLKPYNTYFATEAGRLSQVEHQPGPQGKLSQKTKTKRTRKHYFFCTGCGNICLLSWYLGGGGRRSSSSKPAWLHSKF